MRQNCQWWMNEWLMNLFMYGVNQKEQVTNAILQKNEGKHGKNQILNWEIKNNLLPTQWILHFKSIWSNAICRNVNNISQSLRHKFLVTIHFIVNTINRIVYC